MGSRSLAGQARQVNALGLNPSQANQSLIYVPQRDEKLS